jgi:formylglycine-generating enzyme required for sulfatase activity
MCAPIERGKRRKMGHQPVALISPSTRTQLLGNTKYGQLPQLSSLSGGPDIRRWPVSVSSDLGACNPELWKLLRSGLAPAAEYLRTCGKQERSARSRARWTQAAIFSLLLAVIGGLLARMYERELRSFAYWATTFRGYQLAAANSARLKPGDAFQECAKTFSDDRQDGKQISEYCPDMVVIPAGSYKMGDDQRARIITIKTPFAVSRFAITFDQWDACVAGGGCENNTRPSDQTWGRGSRPVINVDWRDAHNYVAWLNRMTGTDSYRLLSEAEWEYAARGVTSAQAPHPN